MRKLVFKNWFILFINEKKNQQGLLDQEKVKNEKRMNKYKAPETPVCSPLFHLHEFLFSSPPFFLPTFVLFCTLIFFFNTHIREWDNKAQANSFSLLPTFSFLVNLLFISS